MQARLCSSNRATLWSRTTCGRQHKVTPSALQNFVGGKFLGQTLRLRGESSETAEQEGAVDLRGVYHLQSDDQYQLENKVRKPRRRTQPKQIHTEAARRPLALNSSQLDVQKLSVCIRNFLSTVGSNRMARPRQSPAIGVLGSAIQHRRGKGRSLARDMGCS